jgi:hypothetical protein
LVSEVNDLAGLVTQAVFGFTDACPRGE